MYLHGGTGVAVIYMGDRAPRTKNCVETIKYFSTNVNVVESFVKLQITSSLTSNQQNLFANVDKYVLKIYI